LILYKDTDISSENNDNQQIIYEITRSYRCLFIILCGFMFCYVFRIERNINAGFSLAKLQTNHITFMVAKGTNPVR